MQQGSEGNMGETTYFPHHQQIQAGGFCHNLNFNPVSSTLKRKSAKIKIPVSQRDLLTNFRRVFVKTLTPEGKNRF